MILLLAAAVILSFLGVIVPGLDPAIQRGLEIVERAEHAARQAAALQFGDQRAV